MNIAIEYVVRKGVFQESLPIPCSILLNHKYTRGKPLVITLENTNEKINVKHWHLSRCQKEQILPPHEEFIIENNELFSSPQTILGEYTILQYCEDPFRPGEKQGADASLPDAEAASFNAKQELKYSSCMDSFFYTHRHFEKRVAWLWTTFLQVFLPISYQKIFRGSPLDAQQHLVAQNFPIIWRGWELWKKTFYLNSVESPAPELAFSYSYYRKDGVPPTFRPSEEDFFEEFIPKKKKKKKETPAIVEAEYEVQVI